MNGAETGTWRVRIAGVLLIGGMLWYVPWMLLNLNTDALWLAIPFALTTLLLSFTVLTTVANNWWRSVPPERLLPPGEEPVVAVLIPTYGEPPAMVARTAESVLGQDWPHERLRLIIGDDAHSPAIAEVVAGLRARHPAATILYHEPPGHGDPARPGDAKAGNLNSALAAAYARWPEIARVETRDADDEVGDPQFLRHCLGQLRHDDGLAYVQTIKAVRASPGDPFGNQEAMFYRYLMLARNSAKAVFPCGSGVVWRRAALDDIGGFPTWNLVEDVLSGVKAMQRGWRGLYVPIVGALAQHAPEDIPNAYKQRGTWAIDTMRLHLWHGLRGLTLRQRLQFNEMAIFYLFGFCTLGNVCYQVVALAFDLFPLRFERDTFGGRFLVYALGIELLLIALKGRLPYGTVLRMRLIWLGFMPVYIRSCLIALFSGPHRKPVYRVTRKVHQFRWYWRETLPQMLAWLALALALGSYLARLPRLADLEVGLVGWAVFHLVMFGGFIRLGWFGVDWRGELAARLAALTGRARAHTIAATGPAADESAD